MSEYKYRVLYVEDVNGNYRQQFSRPMSLIAAQGCLALRGALEIVEIKAINKQTFDWLNNQHVKPDILARTI